MPNLLRSKLAIQFVFLLLVGTGIVAGVRLVQEQQELREEASTYGNLGCSSITISPSKTKYSPGETVSIAVKGSSQSTNINLYWKSLYLPMKGAGWVQIPGSYNSSTQTLTSSWVIPSQSSLNWTPANTSNQEIIITANNFDANGNFCSGNPGHLSCYDGVYISGGNSQSCCGGCQKKITVDNSPGSGINTKDYLKFVSGNYWEYDGVNFTYSSSNANRNFETRIEIESPTNVCGHKTTALRFLKDKISGYWGPVHSYETTDQWRGMYARRWHTVYFPTNDRWNGGFVGAIYPNSQRLLSPPDHFKGVGARVGRSAWFTSKGQHFYFPPYLVVPDILPSNLNWNFSRQDQIFTFDGASNSNFCDYDNNVDYNTREHAWETSYAYENISTPSYSGQALRIKFLEYNVDGSTTGDRFLLREDWFFAKNIGLVMIRQKNIRCTTNGCSPTRHLTRDNCTFNGKNLCNVPMYCATGNCPELEIKLRKYYIGKTLNVSGSTNWVKPGTSWILDFSDNYTGWLDVYADRELLGGTKDSIENKWLWVQDGAVVDNVPSDIAQGKWTLKFRRRMPDLPTDMLQETPASFSNNLPWSNQITVYFQNNNPFPVPNCSSPNSGITATCNNNYKNDLKCSWSGVVNATEYQGQIDNNSDFSSPIVNTTNTSTSRSVGNVTANRNYYCRSRVTKSNGTCIVNNQWSSTVTAKKACPTPTPTVTPTATATPTPTNTNTPTPTKKPTNTPVPTEKPTNTPVVTSTPIPVAGDATDDGVVDIEDYKVWINNYNSSTQGGPTNADFNNDNQVDGKDYIIWLSNYGT